MIMPPSLPVCIPLPIAAGSKPEIAASEAAEAWGSWPAEGAVVDADTGPAVGVDTNLAVGVGTVLAGMTALVALAAAEYDSPDRRAEIVSEVVPAVVEPGFAADGDKMDAVAAGAPGVRLESAADAGIELHTAEWAAVAGNGS